METIYITLNGKSSKSVTPEQDLPNISTGEERMHKKTQKRPLRIKRLVAACAVIILVGGGFIFNKFDQSKQVAESVYASAHEGQAYNGKGDKPWVVFRNNPENGRTEAATEVTEFGTKWVPVNDDHFLLWLALAEDKGFTRNDVIKACQHYNFNGYECLLRLEMFDRKSFVESLTGPVVDLYLPDDEVIGTIKPQGRGR